MQFEVCDNSSLLQQLNNFILRMYRISGRIRFQLDIRPTILLWLVTVKKQDNETE